MMVSIGWVAQADTSWTITLMSGGSLALISVLLLSHRHSAVHTINQNEQYLVQQIDQQQQELDRLGQTNQMLNQALKAVSVGVVIRGLC